MLMIIYMYVSMYLCHCMTGFSRIILMEEWLLMQVNGMKSVLGLMGNKMGRVALIDLWGWYYVDMHWYYMIVLWLCLCYGQVMLRDTSSKWMQYDLRHARISMDSGNTLEARLLCGVSVWFMDVQYYCCVYVVHVLYSMIVPMVM